jgi:hypothetical protein
MNTEATHPEIIDTLKARKAKGICQWWLTFYRDGEFGCKKKALAGKDYCQIHLVDLAVYELCPGEDIYKIVAFWEEHLKNDPDQLVKDVLAHTGLAITPKAMKKLLLYNLNLIQWPNALTTPRERERGWPWMDRKGRMLPSLP